MRQSIKSRKQWAPFQSKKQALWQSIIIYLFMGKKVKNAHKLCEIEHKFPQLLFGPKMSLPSIVWSKNAPTANRLVQKCPYCNLIDQKCPLSNKYISIFFLLKHSIPKNILVLKKSYFSLFSF